MKREIFSHKHGLIICGCCPGHDKWPGETYNSIRSKRARSKHKQREHQCVRSLEKRKLNNEHSEDAQQFYAREAHSEFEQPLDKGKEVGANPISGTIFTRQKRRFEYTYT